MPVIPILLGGAFLLGGVGGFALSDGLGKVVKWAMIGGVVYVVYKSGVIKKVMG